MASTIRCGPSLEIPVDAISLDAASGPFPRGNRPTRWTFPRRVLWRPAYDELVDIPLVRDLAVEIARIASPESELWADEGFRNLYLLLQRGAEDDFRILASYW